MQRLFKESFTTKDDGNGIGRLMTTQDHFIAQIKVNCEICHQIGTKATREISQMIKSIQVETRQAVQAMEEGVQEVQQGTAEAAARGDEPEPEKAEDSDDR